MYTFDLKFVNELISYKLHIFVKEKKRHTEHTIGFAGRRSTNDNGERSIGHIEE